ncbi:MAG: translation initiation factor IF-3 [Betaproteobacteria bacterium]|nr:translation initiation factor IF-3 [Betaproteobacteria bacterium]
MALERSQRINREITAPEVRLVGAEGEQVGIVPVAEAIRMAEEAEVDLVEIAPMAKPPVCRLMDFGKFRYREQKRAHEAKLKQKQIQIKEVKFRPGTDEGDYAIKLRNLKRFLEEGDKTKVTLRFRGREMAHQELGMRLLQRVKADLELHGVVEQFPRLEGRQMVMVLAPLKKEQRDKIKREAAKKPVAGEAGRQPATKPAAKPALKPVVLPVAKAAEIPAEAKPQAAS